MYKIIWPLRQLYPVIKLQFLRYVVRDNHDHRAEVLGLKSFKQELCIGKFGNGLPKYCKSTENQSKSLHIN